MFFDGKFSFSINGNTCNKIEQRYFEDRQTLYYLGLILNFYFFFMVKSSNELNEEQLYSIHK